MDDTIKGIIYNFINKTMRFTKVDGYPNARWDFYGINDEIYFGVPKAPIDDIILDRKFTHTIQRYIPIDNPKIAPILFSWIKKKYSLDVS